MPSGADTATLAEEAFISITTFKRDGTPVATPVWCARENGWLLVYTEADSGKVKRIRHDPHLSVAPCNFRGKLRGPGSRRRRHDSRRHTRRRGAAGSQVRVDVARLHPPDGGRSAHPAAGGAGDRHHQDRSALSLPAGRREVKADAHDGSADRCQVHRDPRLAPGPGGLSRTAPEPARRPHTWARRAASDRATMHQVGGGVGPREAHPTRKLVRRMPQNTRGLRCCGHPDHQDTATGAPRQRDL